MIQLVVQNFCKQLYILWIGWRVSQRDVHYLHYVSLTARSLSTLVTRLHNAILQCVTIHRVPKFTSCHNAITVVTGRAHCSILLYITLQIYSVEHSYGLGGEYLRDVHYLYYASLTARRLSTLVTPQCNPTMCNRTSCAQVHELP